MEKTNRLENKIIKADCLLHMSEDVYIPDILTRIRILPTVAVVGQIERVRRTNYGFTILEVWITG